MFADWVKHKKALTAVEGGYSERQHCEDINSLPEAARLQN